LWLELSAVALSLSLGLKEANLGAFSSELSGLDLNDENLGTVGLESSSLLDIVVMIEGSFFHSPGSMTEGSP
jgi:hypothetical protein